MQHSNTNFTLDGIFPSGLLKLNLRCMKPKLKDVNFVYFRSHIWHLCKTFMTFNENSD